MIPKGRFSARTLLLGLLLVGFAGSSGAQNKPGKSYPDVGPKVEEARPHLEAATQALERSDKGAAKKSLSKAEKILEDAVKQNPVDRDASETLGKVYYYVGVSGSKSGWEDAVKLLRKFVEKDPEAPQANRLLALSYSRLNDAKETITYANLAASLSNDPVVVQEMTELKRPFQEYFLTSWYEQAKYYESPAARMTQLNPKTYQVELVAQITPQFEQDLAARGLQQITPQLKLAQEPELQKYLQKLVDRLVTKSPGGPPFSYRVDVVESNQINAMAFPGRVLVNTGLLKFTASEAELVAVLSHELGHIYAHHSARALVSDHQKRQALSMLLSAVQVDNTRLRDQLLTVGASVGLKLMELGYSRQQEKEADRYGTHIAFNAGYNPTYMSSFFVRLYEANPKQPFRLLSTHPRTPDRIQYTTAYLEAFPLEQEMQIDSQEFKEIKKRLR